jgi:superfamily II RNA helicase
MGRSFIVSHNSNSAEFAIKYFTDMGKKIIYTSPIKALSNQKYYEFNKKFPDTSIGIITGDITNNPVADVVIMTAEILHNQLQNEQFDENIGCIVFDEIHYINDTDRGYVWEESIAILCKKPHSPQIVMLSATISTPEKFASWIESICDREVYISESSERVVPLTHYTFFTCTKIKKINAPSDKKFIEAHINKLSEIKQQNKKINFSSLENTHKLLNMIQYNKINISRTYVIRRVCEYMQKANMLPCIIFVFSRKNVWECAKELSLNFQTKGVNIKKECEAIIRQLPNYSEYLHLPEYVEVVGFLERGIAIHHGGMLSILREIVEIMFLKNYVKVLFATETFAAGINLPVKTTVFTQLSKYSNQGHRNLFPHEYTQMAGRAGRRGIDTVGHVIHLPNLYNKMQMQDYKNILSNIPQKLQSKLKISFNIVLNMDNESAQLKNSVIDNSMFIMESTEACNNISKELVVLENKFDSFLESDIIDWGVYCDLLDLEQKAKNKDRRKLDVQIKLLTDNNPVIFEVQNAHQAIQHKKYEFSKENDYVADQICSIKNILTSNEFMNKNGTITTKGVFAARLKKVHPLIFAEIIFAKEFDVKSPEQIAALISCFVKARGGDETAPLKEFEIAIGIDAHYESLAGIHQIYTGHEYGMCFDYVKYILKWCAAKDEIECKKILQQLWYTDIDTGDFVKMVLEIANTADELNKACEHIGRNDLCHKLQQIPNLLFKYIAMPQSLYI